MSDDLERDARGHAVAALETLAEATGSHLPVDEITVSVLLRFAAEQRAAEADRLRAQVLEYAEALARTRRESAERLDRVQILHAIVPSAADLDALDDAVGAAYYGQRTIDSTTYVRAVEWLSIAEEAVKYLAPAPARDEATPFGHISRADEAQVEVCGAQCDKGSECLMLPGHSGGHETQHGCIFYDDAPARDAADGCGECGGNGMRDGHGWHFPCPTCGRRTALARDEVAKPGPVGYGARRHICPHCEHFGGFLFDDLVDLPRKCRAHEYDAPARDAAGRGGVPHVCPGCHAVGEERCAPGCIDAEIEAEHRHAIESGDYDRSEEE
jgi:hypothetical protein